MARNSEAVRLAEASDWKGLQRLIEIAPELAREHGDYGMLPIHWACTEPHVPVALLDKLLAAHPDGARTKNAVHLLPLHIAIRARVQPHWLRRLLSANPHAVCVRTPEGLSVLELADQVGLSSESMKVLLDAYSEASSPEQNDDSSSEDDERVGPHTTSSTRAALADDANQSEPQYELLAKNDASPDAMATKRSSERYELLQSHSNEESSRLWPPRPYGISRLTSTDTSDPAESPLLQSLSSLSDAASLDSRQDGRLISPSSTSTSSQVASPSSATSAPLAPPLHKQMAGPFERKHSLDYQRQHQRAAAAATQQYHESVAKRSRNQVQSRSFGPTTTSSSVLDGGRRSGRHLSLPVIPSYETALRYAPPTRDVYHDRSSGDECDDDDDSGRGRRGARFRRFSSAAAVSGPGRDLEADLDAFEREGGLHPSQQPQHHHSPGQVESPPAWKRDDECAICRVAFGMFKHRHHCRNCGQSICSQHSADRKVTMTAKGFKTPQRVCVTCYAVLAHFGASSGRIKTEYDAVLDAAGLSGPNPVAAFAMQQLQQQQQHYALGGTGVRSPQYTSVRGAGSPSDTFVSTAMSASDAALAVQSHVSELRHVVAAQQKQLDALVQSNMQLQQQVLEQEEAKAETTLLITQLMTRVSVLELQQHETQRASSVSGARLNEAANNSSRNGNDDGDDGGGGDDQQRRHER